MRRGSALPLNVLNVPTGRSETMSGKRPHARRTKDESDVIPQSHCMSDTCRIEHARGEVLKLLGIWRGASFACKSATGFGRPSKGAPHGDEITCSQRTREELSALIEGRLCTVSAKDELVKLATRLIVEEALEGRPAMRSGEITTSTVRSRARATVTGIAWDG